MRALSLRTRMVDNHLPRGGVWGDFKLAVPIIFSMAVLPTPRAELGKLSNVPRVEATRSDKQISKGQKITLSRKSMWKGYYYCKSARGKWSRVDQITMGMRWNYFLLHGRTTPTAPHFESLKFPDILNGVMKRVGWNTWAFGVGERERTHQILENAQKLDTPHFIDWDKHGTNLASFFEHHKYSTPIYSSLNDSSQQKDEGDFVASAPNVFNPALFIAPQTNSGLPNAHLTSFITVNSQTSIEGNETEIEMPRIEEPKKFKPVFESRLLSETGQVMVEELARLPGITPDCQEEADVTKMGWYFHEDKANTKLESGMINNSMNTPENSDVANDNRYRTLGKNMITEGISVAVNFGISILTGNGEVRSGNRVEGQAMLWGERKAVKNLKVASASAALPES